MITLRKANERGHADHGWLDSHHTFSFADYYDPTHMGYRALRVINEDRVRPAHGFGTHGHRDMEIVSYVIEGALSHKDSMGTGSTIKPGDVQRMTAGTGVMHSEQNPSKTDGVHFLQIWILPEKKNLTPSYEQRSFSVEDKRGRLKLVGSRDGRDGSVTIHQDVALYAAILGKSEKVSHELAKGRAAYLHVVKGTLTVDGTALEAGDGAKISDQASLTLEGTGDLAEVLLFDLA
jgi:hypothetical protein